MNYYVYYKVQPERLEDLRRAVNRLFVRVQSECGVQGRWMHRRDDPSTYMEVYEGVRDATVFEQLMKREAPGLQDLVVGGARRLEIFISAETPA